MAAMPCAWAQSDTNDSSTNTLRQRLKDKVQAHREARASNASPQKGDAASLERLTKPGTYNFTLRHGGLQRAYLVHVPRGYDAAVPTQVVVAFHGGGGDMNLQANINTGYETVSHYEPRIQADIALGKVSLSAATGSKWEGFDSLMDSRYWANMEAKIGLFDHSELLVFAGSEAGGKVCRNGMCRFVAPFSGLRVELSTRF